MRRALTLLLALLPALASGALLRSEGYYKEKFVQVRALWCLGLSSKGRAQHSWLEPCALGSLPRLTLTRSSL